MATVTFVLGLCGSGKSWLMERIAADHKFDEGFLNDEGQHAALISALLAGKHCAVIEIEYCFSDRREKIVKELTTSVPNVTIEWLCFENDLERANKNCRERTNKGDPEVHVAINSRVSPLYTYPDGAVRLKIWTRGS